MKVVQCKEATPSKGITNSTPLHVLQVNLYELNILEMIN